MSPVAATLNGLHAALDAAPDDPARVLAIAEWYAQQGNLNAAAALHWTVLEGKLPFLFNRDDANLTDDYAEWQEGWFWWATGNCNWGHPHSCELPFGLWEELEHTFEYEPSVFKEYLTRRDAYEALIAAWERRLAAVDDPNRHPAWDGLSEM